MHRVSMNNKGYTIGEQAFLISACLAAFVGLGQVTQTLVKGSIQATADKAVEVAPGLDYYHPYYNDETVTTHRNSTKTETVGTSSIGYSFNEVSTTPTYVNEEKSAADAD